MDAELYLGLNKRISELEYLVKELKEKESRNLEEILELMKKHQVQELNIGNMRVSLRWPHPVPTGSLSGGVP